MSASSRPGEQDHVGPVHAPARPADLLVIGDRRLRGPQVDDESQVGLVEPHPEGARRYQGLELVFQQGVLGGFPFRMVIAPGVRGDVKAALAQEAGGVVGRGHGQRVDNARARQLIQVLGEPGEALLG